jgi:hypothetical protein
MTDLEQQQPQKQKQRPKIKRPNTVEAAQRRAIASAFLSQHPGPQGTTVIAEAIGLPGSVVLHLLTGMAQQGLITRLPTLRGAESLWMWPENTKEPAPPAPTPAPSPATEMARLAEMLRAPQEVELVLGGIMVIVGRNPTTGRIRMILEETKP